jgi:hypothetical protein
MLAANTVNLEGWVGEVEGEARASAQILVLTRTTRSQPGRRRLPNEGVELWLLVARQGARWFPAGEGAVERTHPQTPLFRVISLPGYRAFRLKDNSAAPRTMHPL